MPATRSSVRHLSVLVGVSATLALVAAAMPSTAQAKRLHGAPRMAHVQLLTFNDFHGALQTGGPIVTSYRLHPDGSPVLDSSGRPVPNTVQSGGVAYLAAHLAQARKHHKYSITAAAGDLIGISPLVSQAFYDEPSIRALSDLGLQVSSVGNNEFGAGATELLRKEYGMCLADGAGTLTQNSCPGGQHFAGASFPYLAANVVRSGSARTLFPSYWIRRFGGGVRIGFIGMTLTGTPQGEPAADTVGLRFTDEVRTANALVPTLKRQGVNAIVVLLHQGGFPAYQAGTKNAVAAAAPAGFRCNQAHGLTPTSAIIPIAKRLSPAIDLIVSGHTHQPYICNIPDPLGHKRLVTSASWHGQLFTDIRFTYNIRTHDIVRSSETAINRVVDHTITPDPRIAALVAKYATLVAPIANRVVGQVAAALPNGAASPAGESQLGDLFADAAAADPSIAAAGIPQVAFTNGDGLIGPGLAAGAVTYADAFGLQPFAIPMMSMSLSGQQIINLLNQQWSGPNAGANRKILQVSSGLTYRWQSTPSGPVLDTGSVLVNGVPLVLSQSYRVAANDQIAAGGDGFTTFAAGSNPIIGGHDVDALTAYLQAVTTAHGSWAPPTTPRIGTS